MTSKIMFLFNKKDPRKICTINNPPFVPPKLDDQWPRTQIQHCIEIFWCRSHGQHFSTSGKQCRVNKDKSMHRCTAPTHIPDGLSNRILGRDTCTTEAQNQSRMRLNG